MMSVNASFPKALNENEKVIEPVDHRLDIQILARCIGTALNLGSPLKIGVYYVSKASRQATLRQSTLV